MSLRRVARARSRRVKLNAEGDTAYETIRLTSDNAEAKIAGIVVGAITKIPTRKTRVNRRAE